MNYSAHFAFQTDCHTSYLFPLNLQRATQSGRLRTLTLMPGTVFKWSDQCRQFLRTLFFFLLYHGDSQSGLYYGCIKNTKRCCGLFKYWHGWEGWGGRSRRQGRVWTAWFPGSDARRPPRWRICWISMRSGPGAPASP